MKKLGLYLHIPFCERKCLYCDFLSFGGASEELKKRYITALQSEIKLISEGAIPFFESSEYETDSIFIGGGTPSCLEAGYIYEVMETLGSCFKIAEDAEISMEANPGTLDREKLNIYREAGINRLSIGFQSLDDGVLAKLGRIHDSAEALAAYRLAREAGFENINTDLMFAVPGQDMKSWLDTLRRTAALGPEHLSFYSLQIEEGTPFFEALKKGMIKESPQEEDREMYYGALSLIEASGYRHYEISNAAKKGRECRHNLKYWSMEEYLGLGLGASSFIGGRRFANTDDAEKYFDCTANGGNAAADIHNNSDYDNRSEYIFTGLRKREGISLREFRERFGEELCERKAVRKHLESGELLSDGERLFLSEDAIYISNGILADII